MKRKHYWLKALAGFFAVLLVVSSSSLAQTATTNPSTNAFSQQQLDQILAPIALYPDSLVSQILMASTYPLEIVEADRWANANKNLTGDALAKALEQQTWDPSVKSLVNFPQVLDMMNTKLDWTQQLGDAMLSQQKDVMTTIQQLRQKANAQGTLKSTPQQKVIVEKETNTTIIEATNPNVVYVPIYNPNVVYGSWWYPQYPPYYYYPPGYTAAAAAFTFAAGVAIGAAWGYAWGGCDWHNGNVNVNVNRNINVNHNINRTPYANQHTWQHDPNHRHDVPYHDKATADKYRSHNAATGKTTTNLGSSSKKGTATTKSNKYTKSKRSDTTTKTTGANKTKQSIRSSRSGSGMREHENFSRDDREGGHFGGHSRSRRR